MTEQIGAPSEAQLSQQHPELNLIGVRQKLTASDPASVETHMAVYAGLAQEIESRRRKPVVFRIDGENVGSEGEDMSSALMRVMGDTHNNMNRFFDASGHTTQLFGSQQEYEEMSAQGLAALTPEQAAKAYQFLKEDSKANQVRSELYDIANAKIDAAVQSGDLALRMLWEKARQSFSQDGYVRGIGSYITEDGTVPDASAFVVMFESDLPRWQEEVAIVRKLEKKLNSLPDEPGKIKVAMMRVPKEAKNLNAVNPRRPLRVLAQFPAGTFHNWGGKAMDTNESPIITYSGPDLTPCVEDAYDKLYRLTRLQEGSGKFTARPFYLRGMTTDVGLPEEVTGISPDAQKYIEISFADGSEPIVPQIVRETTERRPDLIYIPTSINSSFLEITWGPDNFAHFQVGRDENGDVISQDRVQYSLTALLNGFSNVQNFTVT